MKLDIESAKYYGGLGDIVMLAWLAEGAKAGPSPIVFHRKRDLELMTLLGLQVDAEPGGISLDPVFPVEVGDHCRRPRLDYIREFLGVTTPLARPLVKIASEDQIWAAKTVKELGSPLVLLFPQVVWKTREWPASYWVELAWNLKENGCAVHVLFAGEDARFKNTPSFQWNAPFRQIAALMRHAALVIGNDSFPVHLAGTVGVPTLALMGPTRSTVFSHMPEVECLSSSLDCTGCHFQPPFRAACDQGCMSLYRLFPEDVLRRALQVIGNAKVTRPP
jgi:ADP-heptose:LPS heptosyltransferase